MRRFTPPLPVMIPRYHPLFPHFNNRPDLVKNHARWLRLIRKATRKTFYHIRGAGFPAMANITDDWGGIRVVWRRSPKDMLWIDFSQRKEQPEVGLMQSPDICTISVNCGKVPHVDKSTGNWLYRTGGLPRITSWHRWNWEYDEVYADVFPAPPCFQAHC